MIKRTESIPCTESNTDKWVKLALKLPPRMLVAGFAGYYSLGLAYHYEIMAAIDRIAMRIFRHFVGYAGLGALMPSFQWYAAWGIRFTAAGAATCIYHMTEMGIKVVYHNVHHFYQKHNVEKKERKSSILKDRICV